MSKIETVLIYILASPLLAYQYLVHLVEAAKELQYKCEDHYFLKKSKMDQRQFEMFIKWRNKHKLSGTWEYNYDD